MFISVVVANYNGSKHIRQAIDSVLSQDFDGYEVIVVDDASTDDSRDIVEELRGRDPSRLRLLPQDNNRGQAASFNVGVSAARGEVICFLDSDDYWLPGKLGRVADAFCSRDRIGFHQHNLVVLRDGVLTDKRFRDVLLEGDCFAYACRTGIIPDFVATSGLSFHSDVLEKVMPIPDDFRLCADGYLTRTCFCHGDVVSDSGCHGVYRVHEDNGTFENPEFNNRAYLRKLLLPALNTYYRDHGFDLFLGEAPRSMKGMWRWVNIMLDVSPRFLLKKFMPTRLHEWLFKYYKKWGGVTIE